MSNVIKLPGIPERPEEPQPYKQIIDVLKAAGCDVLLVPVGALCALCRESESERCYRPACPLYVG
jgi:hypothetical protein